MKDDTKSIKPQEEKKEETVVEEPQDNFYELKKTLVLLEKAAKEKDFRECGLLTKNLKKLRKAFTLPDTLLVLKFYCPDLFNRLKL